MKKERNNYFKLQWGKFTKFILGKINYCFNILDKGLKKQEKAKSAKVNLFRKRKKIIKKTNLTDEIIKSIENQENIIKKDFIILLSDINKILERWKSSVLSHLSTKENKLFPEFDKFSSDLEVISNIFGAAETIIGNLLNKCGSYKKLVSVEKIQPEYKYCKLQKSLDQVTLELQHIYQKYDLGLNKDYNYLIQFKAKQLAISK